MAAKCLAMDLSVSRGLAEQVHAHLRERIVAGTFRDGHRIVETDIAVELGVSRGPVRDAMRMLESEGLVVTSPRRGTRVAVPTEEDAADIYAIREALEPLAATMLVARADARALSELELALDELERAVRADDWAAATIADLHFHGLIFRHSGSRRLLRIWEGMDKPLLLMFQLHRPMYQSITNVLERHRAYFAVLQCRDMAAIAEHARAHVTEYRDRLLGAIRAEQGDLAERKMVNT